MALTDIWFAAGVAWVIGKLFDASKKEKENRERELQRQATPCYFEDGITQAEFRELAYGIGKQIKRIKNVYVEQTVIHCTVVSQTGYTTWNFKTDFNDWGHITGKYWSNSENDDSKIPEHFNNIMANVIQEKLAARAYQKHTFEGYREAHSNTFSGTNRDSKEQQQEDTRENSNKRKNKSTGKKKQAVAPLLLIAVSLICCFSI